MRTLLDLVAELSFVRVGGSPEEKQAAEIILREIDRMKQSGKTVDSGRLMPFAVNTSNVIQSSVNALGRELPNVPFLRSGNINKECKFLYVEQGSEIDFAGLGDLADTAVLLNELVEEDTYKRLLEHHVAAFLVAKGKYYHSAQEAALYPVALRDHFIRNGTIPGFTIASADAIALIQNKAETIHLVLEQQEIEKTSQNVLATIEGTDLRDEWIVLTAHYDSVPVGTGAWDNATGTTALLEIYAYFAANPPRRTLHFIWCGSEELGTLGSRAYVAQNEDVLEKIQFCFNFDMCGTALGTNEIFVTGEKELETFVQQYCKLAGYSAKTRYHVQSSDSAPFCDHDIPALGLSRGTFVAAEIHTRNDLLPVLDEAAMQKNVDFAIRIIGDIGNAAVIPVKKGMSEELKKNLNKYFHRDAEKNLDSPKQ